MAIEKRHFTCVICPIGCEIDVEIANGDVVSMEGNKCAKSEEFVLQEIREPMRILTTTVQISDARWPMLPVRTEKAIPRRLLFDVMAELSYVVVRAPVGMSDVIARDAGGTGVDVVASRSVEMATGEAE